MKYNWNMKWLKKSTKLINSTENTIKKNKITKIKNTKHSTTKKKRI